MAQLRSPFTADLPNGPLRLSPTDVTQFINLDQCRRFLRLRLLEKQRGRQFVRDFGVQMQALPELLARSGAEFEAAVVADIAARFPSTEFVKGRRGHSGQQLHNEQVIAIANRLGANETHVLFQPRLEARLGEWLLRGDVDVLMLRRGIDGGLHVVIADIKTSPKPKVEHRLQVAFYKRMLEAIFATAGLDLPAIEMAILFEGPRHDDPLADPGEEALREAQREDAIATFGVSRALLDRPIDPESYLNAVEELVSDPRSTAHVVARTSFEKIPFHLTYKCDWCPYNELCMKWSAEQDDLSLIPHLTETEKGALIRTGVTTTRRLAGLKELRRTTVGGHEHIDLIPAPNDGNLCRDLATTWPVGPRLDELIHRARRYRSSKHDQIDSLSYIPSKGYGSLPFASPDHNHNLIRIYLDAQHDYLTDRIYMLGSLVAACDSGNPVSQRRRSIVHMTDGPPDESSERQLFVDWISNTLRAVTELAAPDRNGGATAPIHLIFYNRSDQRLLLEGLGRHAAIVLGATPLYDFITQLAAFDSPIATFLVDEIRELKNYPMVCQSLQQVAAYLKFDWNSPERFRDIFRPRQFDWWAKFVEDEETTGKASPWYTGRARFNSQIPLEFAYGAWGVLGGASDRSDTLAAYRQVTPDVLSRFHERRLEALEHVARDFTGNARTEKSSFALPNLALFEQKAQSLAQALDEFVTVERHVWLGRWKSARQAPPERRVLAGDSMTVRYVEADQSGDVAQRNREHARRHVRYQELEQAYNAANPDGPKFKIAKEQRNDVAWNDDGMTVRLRVDQTDWDCDLDEALTIMDIGVGETVVINPRWMVDGRQPAAQQVPFTPTPKKMLYGMRARIAGIDVCRDDHGRASAAVLELTMQHRMGTSAGFLFSGFHEPFQPEAIYSLDPDPNDIMGLWQKKVTEGLIDGGFNGLYRRLSSPDTELLTWPDVAKQAQVRFLSGLDAFQAIGDLHGFEPSKREFIGEHGETPILLVQGPPGTGKSYTSAFALFARIQGAMAAGLPFRVLLSCKTHAATDVLLGNLREVRDRLNRLHIRNRLLFDQHIDHRLLDLPLYRLRPREQPREGVIPLHSKEARPAGAPVAFDVVAEQPWCVVAGTPGAIHQSVKERRGGKIFGHEFIDCLVLDEASQMGLPEAIMAALPLSREGRLIVVGDHRQMPPIVHHDWLGESRRTFQEFKSYRSLFETLSDLALPPPTIKFEESFRLHKEMAEFLRREVYQHDGIAYYSRKSQLLPPNAAADPFVQAVLRPENPLVVVVHDEAESQVVNAFEQALIVPVLEALAAKDGLGLDPRTGLGVVVPHRKQRAALQEAVDCLSIRDPVTGLIRISAVNTVERFQGDERDAILISATESDQEYLIASSEFLLDPRRLTVAISRAKHKVILVASRSVFTLFSANEETFAHAQLWKNLLRRTCVVPLWSGERLGHAVEVWGNLTTTELERRANADSTPARPSQVDRLNEASV